MHIGNEMYRTVGFICEAQILRTIKMWHRSNIYYYKICELLLLAFYSYDPLFLWKRSRVLVYNLQRKAFKNNFAFKMIRKWRILKKLGYLSNKRSFKIPLF